MGERTSARSRADGDDRRRPAPLGNVGMKMTNADVHAARVLETQAMITRKLVEHGRMRFRPLEDVLTRWLPIGYLDAETPGAWLAGRFLMCLRLKYLR